jgi:hypothetical protein
MAMHYIYHRDDWLEVLLLDRVAAKSRTYTFGLLDLLVAKCTPQSSIINFRRRAPHATTVAAVELWLWWSPPLPGGRAAYYNAAPPTLGVYGDAGRSTAATHAWGRGIAAPPVRAVEDDARVLILIKHSFARVCQARCLAGAGG